MKEFNPRWLIQYKTELIDIFRANEDKIKTIIFPIESGSEKILKLMKRGYTASECKQSLSCIRKTAPQIRIFTHVIIGFPGESEEDFEDTKQFLREVHFDEITVYMYEGRPGIEAELLQDKVPETVKHARLSRLLKEFPKTTTYIKNCPL